MAYPVPSNVTTEILARHAFLEAICDRELSLKVRERDPKTVDEAYWIGLRLGAYQSMSKMDARRRAPNRDQLQNQLDNFLIAQRRLQKELEDKFVRQIGDLRVPPQITAHERNDDVQGTGEKIICYNCGRPNHMARQCRQPRRPFGTQRDPPMANNMEEADGANVVTNHTVHEQPMVVYNNIIYIGATIKGCRRTCLIDTSWCKV